MTDTTPSSTPGQYQPPGATGGGFPAPGQSSGGFPPPGAAPAEAPKKSGGARKLLSIIIPVLVVAGFIVYRFVLPAIEDAKYKVGACTDVSLTSNATQVEANVVDCASAEALSKIIAIRTDTPLSAADTACPEEWIVAVERKGDLLCLAEK
jgi:uncharacterized membrane protein